MRDKTARQQVPISLPASFELRLAKDRAKRYDALQRGNADAYDDEAWFDLRCQMENANYLQAAPQSWQDKAWRLRFKPAPRRAHVMRRLQPLRRRWRKLIRPPEGSPRAYAPPFDGEFFGNWIRRLTALGLFSTIFAILVQAATRMEAIRAAQPTEWAATPNADWVLFLIRMFQALVTVILSAATFDLAYYTARRLYRATGFPVPMGILILVLLIGCFGVGLFLVAEGSRQILMELDQ